MMKIVYPTVTKPSQTSTTSSKNKCPSFSEKEVCSLFLRYFLPNDFKAIHLFIHFFFVFNEYLAH
jgi:hypothetical protein